MGLFQTKTEPLDHERLCLLRLARTDRIGPVTVKRLLARFGSAEAAVEALPSLSKAAGGKAFKLVSLEAVEKELGQIQKMRGHLVLKGDAAYPEALSAIDDPPIALTVLGDISLLSGKQLGIVGSRNGSLNGRKFTEKLAKDAVAHDLIVTSGLARGIDTAAHYGALKGQGKTIAVVAGGIDQIYPKENEKLFHEIAEKGAVIAESAYGTAPAAALFPRRNRIVSGLSVGVLVVEATERSGSLITARLAAEQGREVMAVPGYPADPRTAGPNNLIRDGATLIRDINDVLEQINSFSMSSTMSTQNNILEMPQPYQSPENADFTTLEATTDILLNQITTQSIGIDELLEACHISIAEGQTALLALELAGHITRLSGNRVCKVEA